MLTHQSNLEIRILTNDDEAEMCARLMSNSEPWITLKRDYAQSLKIIRQPDREVYLAFADGLFRGFVILNETGPMPGYIQTVCVIPELRSAGIGTELIRFAEKRILRKSPNVFLCCSSFNPRAKKLYERLGYEVIGELGNYIVAGYSEILMRKTTGPWHDFGKKVQE